MPLLPVAHLDLDGAWPRECLPGAAYVDRRACGPQLRYSTTRAVMEQFAASMSDSSARFTLYGSGDFHHLTALWLRRFQEPFTLISFDNHPDWDIRMPRWGCGTWLSRALESPLLEEAMIWGCGNFELEWPHRLFANHRALRERRLQVRPWAERLRPRTAERWPSVTPETWRAEFAHFARTLNGREVYVTIDIDCLRAEEAVSDWEHGLFSVADLVWALGEIRAHTPIAGGDLCGAHSEQHYARFIQRIEARLDHPKLPAPNPAATTAKNLTALHQLWPALTAA